MYLLLRKTDSIDVLVQQILKIFTLTEQVDKSFIPITENELYSLFNNIDECRAIAIDSYVYYQNIIKSLPQINVSIPHKHDNSKEPKDLLNVQSIEKFTLDSDIYKIHRSNRANLFNQQLVGGGEKENLMEQTG